MASTKSKQRGTGARGSARQTTDDLLYERVRQIVEHARGQVARTVNTAMVLAYWHIGREIVEIEQAGEQRATYGDEVIKRLAGRLARPFGTGFGITNLKRMRQFYRVFPTGSLVGAEPRKIGSTLLSQLAARGTTPARPSPVDASAGFGITNPKRMRYRVVSAGSFGGTTRRSIGSTALSQLTAQRTPPARPSPADVNPRAFPPELAWSHYLVLMRVSNDQARAFYEIEAGRECWSVRQLERQIGSLLFERLASHRDPDKILALARHGQDVATPGDVIKDPFVLEFLDLAERPQLHERDIEQAIIDRLEAFMLELGRGFCFVGRQRRLTIDSDHFYVDLVFYNRLLRSFVLIDLKLGKLTHQDLGQMQMYVNYFDRTQRCEHEHKTIGIVLCSEQNAAMVKITLPEDNEQIIAATYRQYLPTEAELRGELEREREKAERVLRLTAPS